MIIRFKGFLVLSALAVLGGCGGGSGGGDAPGAGPGAGAVTDTTAPTVASIVPAEGATAIAINGPISATFSEPMDTSFGATTFTVKPAAGGPAISGTVAFSGNTATFTPSTNLDAGITYTATITMAAKDVAGNALAADKAWNFTTGAVEDKTAPTVSSTTPSDLATGIALSPVLSASFSEAMTASTSSSIFTLAPTAGGTAIAGTVALSGTTATFIPSSSLTASTQYTATLTVEAKDAAGNPLAANKVWKFTTGLAPDTTAPTVTSTSPADGATGVGLSPVLTATFSEPMTASTSNSIFTLAPTAGGAAIAGTVSLSGTTATFTPGSSLTADTLYTATVTTGVKDAAGIALAANKTWGFRTAAAVVGGAYTGSYLFHKGFSSGTNSTLNLSAVDPAIPGSPIALEAGNDVLSKFGGDVLISASYDAATKSISSVRNYAVVYAKTDGKLYKASAFKSAGVPTPVQMSNETTAQSVCSSRDTPDYANPENSQIVYSLPSTGSASCGSGNDVYRMVRLGMSASETPVVAKIPIAELYDWSTGAIAGWLVNDNGKLKRCDKNFAGCGMSLLSIPFGVRGYREADSGNRDHMLFSIDQGMIGQGMYVYNYDTGAISPEIGTGQRGETDGDKFYIYADTSDQKSIYSAPADGSAHATALVTDADYIDDIFFTANKVVYVTYMSTSTTIKSISKSGGVATVLVSVGAGRYLGEVMVSGNHVYYTVTSDSAGGSVRMAGVIDDDGSSKLETPNAAWVGGILNDREPYVGELNYRVVIRAEGFDAQGAGKKFAGGTLRSFTAANKSELAVLGVIPSDMGVFSCGMYGSSNQLLCSGSADASSKNDILYLNVETSDSVARVTATPSITEYSLTY